MKVKSILNSFLEEYIPSMHKVRRNALIACVDSVTTGNSLAVTSMGRGINSDAREKHNIKRSDRLCSNTNLQKERTTIYQSICQKWLPTTSAPVILVDWSDLDERKTNFLISATLAFDGRPITLYQEVHSIKTKEKPATHKAFLEKLKTFLPAGSRPIIVTDAGFKVPWFKLVVSLGWDYVGRSRKPNFYSLTGGDKWQNIEQLFKQATTTARHFRGQIAKSNPFDTTFVLYKKRSKGRHKITKQGEISRSSNSKQHANGAKEPWLLITSLSISSRIAKRVVKIYKTRMQIEEGFRDMKSEHYGLGFNVSLSRKPDRISILMLIAALAAMVLLIIGTVVEISGLARYFQANTIKNRRVLSLHFLAQRAILDTRIELEPELFKRALKHMNQLINKADQNLGITM